MDRCIVFSAGSTQRIGPGIADAFAARTMRRRNHTPARQIPQGRTASTVDLAGALAFLASDEARYITGQMLCIDGGILAKQLSWGAAP